MYKLNRLLGKPVTDSEGNSLGEITAVSWSKPLNSCVITTRAGKFRLNAAAKTNAIVADERERLDGGTDIPPITPNQEIFDTDGKYLGKVDDAEFNNAAKLTKVVDAEGKTYPRGRIYAIGDIILIKKPAVKKVKTTAKIKPAAATPEPIPNDVRPNTSVPAEKDCARFPIKRRYGDFSFLIGKTADKNITNFYGEIMLKQGEKITLDALRQAKLSGKLIELCLHAK